MLILLELDAPRKDIELIKDKIKLDGCIPHEIPGERKLAIGITGPTNLLKEEEFKTLPSVREVVRVTENYKLVGRQMKKEDTIISLGNKKIGGNELTIIAGPCAVEQKDIMFEIAENLKNLGLSFLRGGAYKPRSSPYSFQGLKEKGLQILSEVKKEYNLKIVTELLDPTTIEAVLEVADIIQIGARNMQNFTLLERVGESGKPILLKRGLSATLQDFLLSAEYILSKQNFNVILCERGIRTFENATRNTLDLNAIPVLKNKSHLPIFIDPSHGIGIRKHVSSMALAGIAAGADGIIIEVHTNPATASSDGFQTLDFTELSILIDKIKLMSPIVNKTLSLK